MADRIDYLHLLASMSTVLCLLLLLARCCCCLTMAHSLQGRNDLFFVDSSDHYLTDQCLRCLCAASSDCKTNSRCKIIEPDTYLCGPYRISEKYWLSSGQMVPSSVRSSNPLAFEMCALDLNCSIRTVSHLINRYVDRCGLRHKGWHPDIKCMLSAFVHYRAMYLATSEDSEEYFDSSLQEEGGDDRIVFDESMSCDVNSTNLVQQVEQLQSIAPATRWDEDYWPRFDQCYHIKLIDTTAQ